MVKIRLRRTGKRGQAYFRIVAADSKSPRDGRFIEILGHYNPRTKPSTVKINKDLVQKWLDQGAQPTETVRAIFVKEGILKKQEYKPMPQKKEKIVKKPFKKPAEKSKTPSTQKKGKPKK